MTNPILIFLETLIVILGIFFLFAKNIFKAAMFFLLIFVGICAIYFCLQLNFIAAIELMIYVGGVVILLIFAIFLTKTPLDKLNFTNGNKHIVLSGLACALLFVVFYVYEKKSHIAQIMNNNSYSDLAQLNTQQINVSTIGNLFLDMQQEYFLPFEMISLILLLVLVGCVMIIKQKFK